MLDIALKQICFAREITLSLLDGLSDDDYFAMPGGSPTHIAWQVGHLAMAEYGLCLFRMRGRQPDDLQLMPGAIRKAFSRGSVPEADRTKNPSVAEIRALMTKIHEQVLVELPALPAAVLEEPTEMPYTATPTKLGALLFCAQHESLHAGQIGLLRRLLGKPPIR